MNSIIIAEHDNIELKPNTLNTVTAANQLDFPIDILVIGSDCQGVAEEAAQISNVRNVLVVNQETYEHQLAEEIAPVIKSVSADYSHIFCPSSTFGKNIMPRVAALLDCQQISDITEIESDDTFVRPIYAGNALATVRSHDSK